VIAPAGQALVALCDHCGAPTVIAEDMVAHCAHCGRTESLPTPMAERLAMLQARVLRAARQRQIVSSAELGYVRIFEGPEGLRRVLTFWGCVGVVPAVFAVVAGTLYSHSFSAVLAFLTLMVPCTIAAGFSASLLAGRRRYRANVRGLLAARREAGSAGGWTCRVCTGPVVHDVGAIVTCTYCGVANLVSRIEHARQAVELYGRETYAVAQREKALTLVGTLSRHMRRVMIVTFVVGSVVTLVGTIALARLAAP
jgi:uncharacterized Zn finger protein (UPF0148 family)